MCCGELVCGLDSGSPTTKNNTCCVAHGYDGCDPDSNQLRNGCCNPNDVCNAHGKCVDCMLAGDNGCAALESGDPNDKCCGEDLECDPDRDTNGECCVVLGGDGCNLGFEYPFAREGTDFNGLCCDNGDGAECNDGACCIPKGYDGPLSCIDGDGNKDNSKCCGHMRCKKGNSGECCGPTNRKLRDTCATNSDCCDPYAKCKDVKPGDRVKYACCRPTLRLSEIRQGDAYDPANEVVEGVDGIKYLRSLCTKKEQCCSGVCGSKGELSIEEIDAAGLDDILEEFLEEVDQEIRSEAKVLKFFRNIGVCVPYEPYPK